MPVDRPEAPPIGPVNPGGRRPIYMPPGSWPGLQPIPDWNGIVGDPTTPPGLGIPAPAPAPAPVPTPPPDPNITPGPGESSGRTYGKFRQISQRGGPEFRISNTQEMIRRAAARRLGLD